MKTALYLSVAVVCILFLSACQQKLYFPDRANAPGLMKSLEAKATISIKPQANGIDTIQHKSGSVGTSVDLAFSPVNHFGIIGSYRWINNRIIKEDQTIGVFYGPKTMGGVFNGNRWELGAGYYNAIEGKTILEFYGGFGTGSLSRRGVKQPGFNYDTKYRRFFLQPAMGARINDYFSFSAGFKLAFVSYYDFTSEDPDFRYEIGNYQEDITKPVFAFIEPFFNFEGGYKFFKGNIQTGFTRQINQANISGNLPLYISLGMTFMFSSDFLKPSSRHKSVEY